MREQWRNVRGFEGLYQVSNYGRVKSLARWIERTNNGGYWQPEKIRRIAETRGGYLFLPLHKDKQNYPKRVNRLVAEAFLDDYSEEKEVHHIDGNRHNNRVDNLECLTAEEHQDKHKREYIIEARRDDEIMIFNSLEDTRAYGFDPPNVSRCCKCAKLPEGHPMKRKYATHKGWTWRRLK